MFIGDNDELDMTKIGLVEKTGVSIDVSDAILVRIATSVFIEGSITPNDEDILGNSPYSTRVPQSSRKTRRALPTEKWALLRSVK